jgi:hypothetical protein
MDTLSLSDSMDETDEGFVEADWICVGIMLAKGEVESDCNQSSFVFQNRWQKQQCRYYRIIKHFGGFIFAVQVLQHLYNDALPDPSFFVYRHINSCASFNQMSLQPLDHHLWKFG